MSESDASNRKYTYQDLLAMPESFRCELIHGEIYAMSTAPSERHQQVHLQLTEALIRFLKGKPCRLRYAPYDVRLSPKEDNSDDIVLQPDLFVVCDRSKITRRGCFGAPDLVIEILSPSSASRDYYEKRLLYESYGVKEYWIVVPEVPSGSEHVLVLSLSEGKYREIGVFSEGYVESVLFPDMKISLADIFAYD